MIYNPVFLKIRGTCFLLCLFLPQAEKQNPPVRGDGYGFPARIRMAADKTGAQYFLKYCSPKS